MLLGAHQTDVGAVGAAACTYAPLHFTPLHFTPTRHMSLHLCVLAEAILGALCAAFNTETAAIALVNGDLICTTTGCGAVAPNNLACR